MSAPPSPHIGLATLDKAAIRKRDRPPALAIVSSDPKAVSDGEVRYEHPDGNHDNDSDARQPQFRVSPAEESQYPVTESESEIPRSASATSSLALDPYYFGMPSREQSPALHNICTAQVSTTPDTRQISEPVTPARDPGRIDRKGLIGVGELATPRWVRGPRYGQDEDDENDEEGIDDDEDDDDDGDELLVAEIENDGPDSPWTIEAVNSGSDEKDEPTEVRPVVRTIRTRPSMTEESGGEEILYPRHTLNLSKQSISSELLSAHEESPLPSPSSELPPIEPESILQTSPPSAFAPLRTSKKRTSDEFEFDDAGTLVTKSPGILGRSKEKGKEERTSTRKHLSLGVGVPSSMATPRDKGKERQRDTVGLSPGATPRANTAGRIDRHLRQTSASSSSSAHADALAATRRVHPTDFSHLPPSPSSSSIKQFLYHAANNVLPLRPSSRDATVAHSLLRGAQEGWSSMEDEATVEVLRKLDGLSGKGARARASVGSVSRSTSRPASLSRPGTPATLQDVSTGT
jgi:dual specificity tyrosine-phosphorylation-regulated kinase 2/3/4